MKLTITIIGLLLASCGHRDPMEVGSQVSPANRPSDSERGRQRNATGVCWSDEMQSYVPCVFIRESSAIVFMPPGEEGQVLRMTESGAYKWENAK